MTLLAEHVRLYRPGDDSERWLFPGARDGSLPAHAATVSRWWRIVREKVGIEHRLHDLRHFYASGLIAAGCDVVTVQRALGTLVRRRSRSTPTRICGRTRMTVPGRPRQGLMDQALGAAADALRTEGQN